MTTPNTKQTSNKHYLTAAQLRKVWAARDTASELTSQIENLPCWILEEKEWGLILDSMDKVRTLLNTSKEVIHLQQSSPYKTFKIIDAPQLPTFKND